MLTKQILESIIKFIWDKKYCIIAVIISLFIYHKLFFPTITETTVEKEKIVYVTVHDTVEVIKNIPIEKIVYVKDTSIILDSIKLDQIDSLYNEFVNNIKQGKIPEVKDTITFETGDFLDVKYQFPPKNSFIYNFKAANDTIIHENTTITKYVKDTNNLSFYFGGVYNYETQNMGPKVGLKIFSIGADYSYLEKNNIFGLSYYRNIKLW